MGHVTGQVAAGHGLCHKTGRGWYVTRCPGAGHKLCCMISIKVCLLGVTAGRYWNFAEGIMV